MKKTQTATGIRNARTSTLDNRESSTRLESIKYGLLATVCISCLAADAEAAPSGTEVAKASASITAAEFVGRQTTGPTTYSNRCVDTVEKAFAALPSAPSGRIRYRSRGGSTLPPGNAKLEPFGSFEYHVQGITRFASGFDNDRRWIAVSRAHKADRAGFFLVHLNDADGADGTRLLVPGKQYSSEPTPARETKFYYPLKGTAHPGGMQAFGQFLAIASEAPLGSSFVDIYDFRKGPGSGRELQRVYIRASGTSFQPGRVIGGAAVSMLRDGRFLMFVLGQDKKPQGWFLVSDNANLTSATQWLPISQVNGDSQWGAYQNATLLTECNTGKIYVLLTGNDGYASDLIPGTNVADLFRASASNAGVNMTRVGHRTFTKTDDGFCTFRAAATGHVDKDGKLAMYCHAHHANTDIIDGPDSKLKMEEYASSGCLSTQTQCGSSCCSQGSSCVNGTCCAVANSCGSACCGNGSVCKDASRSLCCDSLSTACGSQCCSLQEQCVNGACVVPKAPPPSTSTPNCGIYSACNASKPCPGNQICFGTGCCGILR